MQAVKAWEEQTVSAHAPAREEPQTHIPSEISNEPVTGTDQGTPLKRGRPDAFRRARLRVAVAFMGATTLMSLGALLGAKFIGRRVMRQGSTRVKGGSATIVIMFPFTTLSLYGRPPRRLNLSLPSPLLRIRRLRVKTAR